MGLASLQFLRRLFRKSSQTENIKKTRALVGAVAAVVEMLECRQLLTACISTDAADYPFGGIAHITGADFAPGEIVRLQVVHAPGTRGSNADPQNQAWYVTANTDRASRGAVKTEWKVDDPDALGATYVLSATGLSSGEITSTMFTDGGVSVTPASGGTNISADKAANAISPAYTQLGNIGIGESTTGDLADTGGTATTLILSAPAGWAFQAGAGSVSFSNNRNIKSASIAVTASTITVGIIVSGTTKLDTLSISGIRVRSANGSLLPNAGNILRTSINPGTARIAGITNDVANFGSLSQVAGAPAQLAFGQQPSTTMLGLAISPAPTVRLFDQFGALSATTVNVTLGLASNPSGGSLGGTKNVSAVGGVATFSKIWITAAGDGYWLLATSGTLPATTSGLFSVTRGTTTTSLVTSNANSTYGQSITFTATVKATGNTPSGIVSFLDGSVSLGTGLLSGSSGTANAVFATSHMPAGVHAITAVYAGDNNFIGSTSSALTERVKKSGLTVTANTQTRQYGQPNPLFAASYSGFVNGDTTSVISGAPNFSATADANSPVGAYSIIPGIGTLAAANYDFTSFVAGALTVTKAPLTVTAEDQSREYGDNNPVFTFSYSGFVNSDDARVISGEPSLDTIAGSSSPVGSYDIQIAQGNLAAENYDFTFVPGSLVIKVATLTVTPLDVDRGYGQSDPGFQGIITGQKNGESFTGTFGTTAMESSPVGTYEITVISVSGATLSNYDLVRNAGRLTVALTPLSITAADQSRTYGQDNSAFQVSYSGFVLGEDPAVLQGALTYTTAATAASSVGSYQIMPGGMSSPNYAMSFLSGTLTVTKAELTVKADDQSREYGDANPVFTASYRGFVNGEDASVISGGPSFSTTADASSPVGDYSIEALPGTLATENYEFTFVPGTLAVTLPAITLPDGSIADGWSRRCSIVVSNTSGGTLHDELVKITLTSENLDFGNAAADGSDVRVTDAANHVQSYWIQSWDAASQTGTIWARTELMGGDNTLYVYYANASPGSFDVPPAGPFQKYASPILPDNNMLAENIVYDDVTSKYWMVLYSAADVNIYLAYSTDLVTWTKDAAIKTVPGDGGGGAPCLYFDNGTYYLYYAEGTRGIPNYSIVVATSSTVAGPYTDYSSPMVSNGPAGSWEYTRVMEPYVFKDGSTYYMYYMGDAGGYVETVGYATALTPTGPWTKSGANPTLGFGAPNTYDAGTVADPWVYKFGSAFYVGYAASATTSSPWVTALATTTDHLTFQKRYVLLGLGSSGSYSANDAFRGAVSRFGDTYYLSFTGNDTAYRAGLATQSAKSTAAGFPQQQVLIPPGVSRVSPAKNKTDVAVDASVTATFTESVQPQSIAFVLRDSQGNALPANVTYDALSRTTTLTPVSPLARGTTYSASLNAMDLAGDAMSLPFVWSFTTVPAADGPYTLWNNATVPSVISIYDSKARKQGIELGLKFRSDVDGYVTGIRFYKGSDNTGTHLGHLWSSDGTLLASATFVNETNSGWQQVVLDTPMAIAANTTYIVSYYDPTGHFSDDVGYFANSGYDNGPLHALRDGVDGGNGVFVYGGSAFPTQSSHSSNYWVDLVFTQ